MRHSTLRDAPTAGARAIRFAAALAVVMAVAACGAAAGSPVPTTTAAVTAPPVPTPVPTSVPTPAPATGTPAPGAGPFTAALAAWQARGIDSYTWQVSFGCECLLNGPVTIVVEGGTVTGVSASGSTFGADQLTGFPLTVDAVLARAIDAIAGGGTADVTWRQDGLPETLRLDPVKDAVDDELTVSVLAFAPAG